MSTFYVQSMTKTSPDVSVVVPGPHEHTADLHLSQTKAAENEHEFLPSLG